MSEDPDNDVAPVWDATAYPPLAGADWYVMLVAIAIYVGGIFAFIAILRAVSQWGAL